MGKKSALVSLFIYIALFLGYGITSLVIYISAKNGAYEGWQGLGMAFLMIFFMIFAGVAGIAMILKIVHVAAGWGFFGFLCILIDIASLAILIYYFVIGGASLAAVLEVWYFFIPIPALLVSLPANFKSLAG